MMRRSLLLIALLVGLAVAPAGAFSKYYIEYNGRIHHPHWSPSNLPVRFVMNDRSVDLLTNVSRTARLRPTIESAMKAWNQISPIGLQLDGMTPSLDGGRDGVNLISFANTPKNREIVGDNLAVTPTFFTVQNNELLLGETDVVFTTKHTLTADLTSSSGDIESIALHEFGHVFGLLHSPMPDSVMYAGSGPFNNESIRKLSTDDIAGIHSLYLPTGAPGTGSLVGQVLTAAGAPVLGANVVAVDANGVTPVCALTDAQGRYQLPSLAPGDYQVYAEPLFGHATPPDIFSEYHMKANTAFRAAFAGGNRARTRTRVTAGGLVSVGSISVEAKKPDRYFRHLLWWDGAKWISTKPQLRSGESRFVIVYGAKMDAVPAFNFKFSGTEIAIDWQNVQTFSPNDYDPASILPITVQGRSKPGPRSLLLDSGGELNTFSAVVEILP